MKKQSWLARAFLLGVSLLSSIDAVSASWLITGDHTDKADTTASIATNNTTAVCYIKETGVYYTSLDKALYVAEKVRTGVKDTICVIPNLGSDVTIGDSHTIESGDSLVLPYAYENSDKSVTYIACGMNIETGDSVTVDAMLHGDGSVTFADQDATSVSKYRQTRVVVSNDNIINTITLTVEGSLLIGGKLSNPGAGVSGQTTGSYCEMVLSKYAHIKCDGGKIECDGYIKRSKTKENGDYSSLIVTGGGTLKTPLVIYDYKGGSYTYAAARAEDKISPFYVFDFPNVQTKVQVNYSSYWESKICIYANLDYFPSDGIYFIAPSNNSNVSPILSQESGSIYVDYVPANNGYTSKAVDGTKTSIAINGNASIGSIKFVYKIVMETSDHQEVPISVEIDSSKFYLPISYRFNFTLESGSTLNSPKKIKFMNGSSVEIENGATLNVSAPMAIYGSSFEDSNTTYPYPSIKNGNEKIGASFKNNGTLYVSGDGVLGGVIDTSDKNGLAVLNYATKEYTVNSPETDTFVSNGINSTITTKDYSCLATGPLSNDNGENFADGSIVYSADGYKSIYNGTTGKSGWLAPGILISTVAGSEEQTTTQGSIQVTANSSSEKLTWSIQNKEQYGGLVDIVGSGSTVTIVNTSTQDQNVVVEAVDNTTMAKGTSEITVQGKQWWFDKLSLDVTETSNGKSTQKTTRQLTKAQNKNYKVYSQTDYKTSTEYDITVKTPEGFDPRYTTFHWRVTIGSSLTQKANGYATGYPGEIYIDYTNDGDKPVEFPLTQTTSSGTQGVTSLKSAVIDVKNKKEITLKIIVNGYVKTVSTGLNVQIDFSATITDGNNQTKQWPENSSVTTQINKGHVLKFFTCKGTDEYE